MMIMGSKHFDVVSARVQQLFQQALDERNQGRYDAELWRYYGNLKTAVGSAKRTRFVYDLCRLAHFTPEDKVILDAGCGFGVLSIILRLMGAREVHGIDIMESRLTTFQKMIEDFHLQGIYTRYASVDNTGFPSKVFDMVLSNEAISHYQDVDAFLREAARVLKVGGVLIIADGNNGANPWVVRHTRQIWERFENGPPGEIDGHQVIQPYVEMRAEIIQQAYPDLPKELVQELARRTSGMTREQIVQVVDHYCQTGEMPAMFYHSDCCPVNPKSGIVLERLFHPAELARRVETFGFRARYYAYFGGAGGNPLLRLINAIGMTLSPLTVGLARGYRIVAVRKE